jgi:hypothetical protein
MFNRRLLRLQKPPLPFFLWDVIFFLSLPCVWGQVCRSLPSGKAISGYGDCQLLAFLLLKNGLWWILAGIL